MKNILIILASLFFLSACDRDLLNQLPEYGPSDASFYTNEAELKMAITGVYNTLYTNTEYDVNLLMVLDCAADVGWYRMAGGNIQHIGNGSHDSQTGIFKTYWGNFYAAIARCNILLEKMPNAKAVVDPKEYGRIESEARFFRVFNYWHLTELFGDVPLIKQTQTLETSKVPRDKKELVVDFMINELKECVAALPAEAPADGRISQDAAWALLSRIALYNQKWQLAIEASQQVMNSGKHKLHNSYPALFNYDQKGNKEVIFYVTSLTDFRMTNQETAFASRLIGGSAIYVPTQSLVDSYECTDGLPIHKSPLFDPMHPYNNRDPRLAYVVALPGSNYFGFQFETHRDSIECWDYNVTPAKRIPNTEATHAYASFTGYNFRKWTDPKDKSMLWKSTIQFVLLRYAEVLLNYAEAKIEANQIDDSVYDAINQIRQRETVGMPPLQKGLSQSDLRNALRRERKYELVMEGFRLFDIRRWKIAEKVMPGPLYGRVKDKDTPGVLLNAPTIDELATPDYRGVSNKEQMSVIEQRKFNPNRDYLWPIPRIELDTNDKLVQNPGY